MNDLEVRNRRYEKLVGKLTGTAVAHDAPKAFRGDGYINVFNKYGTMQDVSEHYFYEREADVPDETLERFYEGNGLFSRIIDAPAEEALRTGFKLKNIDDEKINMFVERSLDELSWEETAITAIKWTRLFGGAIAVMLINDGRGLEEPLDWKHIESIDDIRIYDRSIIVPDYESMYSYEPEDPFRTRGSRLGMPESYFVTSRYGSFTVHESRCLIFQNGVLPENASTSIYQMWGMPEYIRINKAIRDAEVAAGSATKLLDRAVQAVYSMKDLAVELSTEEGEDRVLRRLEAIDMARGMMNTITIDAEGEDYSFRQFSFTGVSEVIDTTCNYLSALTNIPQTILFGRSPAGMSATGESDLENYYNYVQRIQKRMLRSNLRYLLGIIFQAGVTNGEIEKVPKIDVEFNPLWSMSDMEKEQLEQAKIATQTARAQAAQLYVGMDVVTAAEVRRALAQKETFDVETMLDEEDEKELFPDGMPKYGQQPQQEQGAEGAPGGGDPMAALMGGGDPMGGGALSNGGGEGAEPNGLPEGKPQGKPGEKPKSGNAMPDAPEATRLPEDQSPNNPKTPTADETVKAEDVKFQKDSSPCGVGVVVVKDGKILTGVRKSDNGYGLLCGPGGKIEDGESPREAAARETHEEFKIYPKDLIFIGRGKKDDQSEFDPPYLFLCTEYYGEPEADEFEMTRPRWRSVKEIKGLQCFNAFEDGVDVLCRFIGEVPDPAPKRRKKAYNFDKNKLTDDTHCDSVNADAVEKTSFITVHPNGGDGVIVEIDKEGTVVSGSMKGQKFPNAHSVPLDQLKGKKYHGVDEVKRSFPNEAVVGDMKIDADGVDWDNEQKGIKISAYGKNESCKGFDAIRSKEHYLKHAKEPSADNPRGRGEPILTGMSEEKMNEYAVKMLSSPCGKDMLGFSGYEYDYYSKSMVGYVVRFEPSTGMIAKGYPGKRVVDLMVAQYRDMYDDVVPNYKEEAMKYYNRQVKKAQKLE